MEPTSHPPGARSHSARPPSAGSDRVRGWSTRAKQSAVALLLVGSTFFAGIGPSIAAAASPALDRAVGTAPESAMASDAEQALGGRLALEYAGAVPAAEVKALVGRVSRRLRRDSSPPERLLHTAEAVCRRALTDYLARGVPLPGN